MEIVLNGTPTEVTARTVADLLGPDDRQGIAVAVNGVVVPRSLLDARPLADGDVVEVVTAVQGG